MTGRASTIPRTATVLSRNPLGLLALCLVVGEGLASAALLRLGDLPRGERTLLCLFVVAFPLVVVAAIYRLVSRHHTKLYAPADYRDERCFLEVLQLTGGAAPLVATRAVAGDDFELLAPLPAANGAPLPAPGVHLDGRAAYFVTRRGRVFLLRDAAGAEARPPREVARVPDGCRRVDRQDCDRELRALADVADALGGAER